MDAELTQPRPLTIPEMWASWDFLIDEPAKEIPLSRGSQVLECLPVDARNDASWPHDKTPTYYPLLRTDYHLRSTKDLVNVQCDRALRLLLIRDLLIFLNPKHDRESSRQWLRSFWEGLHNEVLEQTPLQIKLDLGLEEKDKANKLHREGNWLKALYGYAFAWTTVLPYHLDAVPASDPQRLALASFEFTIFNNIMATVLELYKAVGSDKLAKAMDRICMLGRRAGVHLLELSFGCNVGQMKKALSRLQRLKEASIQYPPDSALAKPKQMDRTIAMLEVVCKLNPDDSSPAKLDTKAAQFPQREDNC